LTKYSYSKAALPVVTLKRKRVIINKSRGGEGGIEHQRIMRTEGRKEGRTTTTTTTTTTHGVAMLVPAIPTISHCPGELLIWLAALHT